MHRNTHDERGFVSIIVASILMVLVSLIVLGFATIMQREQRQSLDRQLSTQAFYAAETGVNDLAQLLQTGALDAPADLDKTTCDVSDPARWRNGVIRADEPEIRYTCLLYDQAPEDLVFTDTIGTSNSEVFPVEPVSGSNVQSVTFSWNGPDPSNRTAIDGSADCLGNLPTSYAAESIPVLRVDLIAARTSGGFDRAYINANTASYYFVPSSCAAVSPTVTNFAAASGGNAGQIVYVACNATDACSVTINNMASVDGGSGSDRFYARVKSIYNDVGTLNVTAVDSNPSFRFKNAQTIADVTGKATDVLRRIEVRISNRPDYDLPEAVIETEGGGICKTLGVIPGAPTPVSGANCYD